MLKSSKVINAIIISFRANVRTVFEMKSKRNLNMTTV